MGGGIDASVEFIIEQSSNTDEDELAMLSGSEREALS